MKIVIAGAGEVGTHLARMLSQEDHEIVLLDDSPENLSAIKNEADVLTVIGSAHSFKDLKETGLSKADLFIAVTPYEERNLLACSMASYLGVKRTIARINNSEFLQETYKEKLNNMGINELIYPESLAAKEIIASLKQTTTRQIIDFSNGKLILLGIKVRDNAAVLNKKLTEIYKEKEDIRVLAINRDSITYIPDEAQQIINGDIVFFITTPENQLYVFETTGKKPFAIKNIMFLGGSRIAQKTIEKLGTHYNIWVIEIEKNGANF
jgi:trk system potassium uptake protein TrkA